MKLSRSSTLLLLFLLSCGSESSEMESVGSPSFSPDTNAPAIAVEALVLSKGKLVNNIISSGIIRSAQEAWVISQQSGVITDVFVSPGDYVQEGAPLLKVDDELAYWDMKRAEQQFLASEFEYKGIKDSYGIGAISEVEYNRSYSTLLNGRSSYEMASRAYEDCTLKAPFTGYVSQMDTTLSEGNFLNRGTPVLKVINMDNYILEISPGQREIGLIEKGGQVEISVDLADRTLTDLGSVLDISAGSNESTGSFPVRVLWKNSWGNQVRPGMTARAQVRTNDTQEGVIIPFDKVIERDGKKWVFLAIGAEKAVESDQSEHYVVEARQVVLGSRLGNRVIVVKGLTPGEVLIGSGFSSLVPGSLVTLTLLGKSGEWQ